MLAAILNLLRGYRTRFDAFERAILGGVREALPEHLRAAFDDRLGRINRIQPVVGGQEIILYDHRRGEVRFPESGRIVTTDDSIRIATVDLESDDDLSRLRANIYCGHGMLASITFNKPSEHADADRIRGTTVRLQPGTPWI